MEKMFMKVTVMMIAMVLFSLRLPNRLQKAIRSGTLSKVLVGTNSLQRKAGRTRNQFMAAEIRWYDDKIKGCAGSAYMAL